MYAIRHSRNLVLTPWGLFKISRKMKTLLKGCVYYDLQLQLQSYHNDLFPFVGKLKSHVKDITDTPYVCAIYLLLCRIFDGWRTVFILSEKGKSSAIGNIIRMIKEDNMLVNLLAIEFSRGASTNLDKWFSDEVVSHSIGREAY